MKFTEKYNLNGNHTFGQLNFNLKIKVLKMIKDAIYEFVRKEIGEELLDKIFKKRYCLIIVYMVTSYNYNKRFEGMFIITHQRLLH